MNNITRLTQRPASRLILTACWALLILTEMQAAAQFAAPPPAGACDPRNCGEPANCIIKRDSDPYGNISVDRHMIEVGDTLTITFEGGATPPSWRSVLTGPPTTGGRGGNYIRWQSPQMCGGPSSFPVLTKTADCTSTSCKYVLTSPGSFDDHPDLGARPWAVVRHEFNTAFGLAWREDYFGVIRPEARPIVNSTADRELDPDAEGCDTGEIVDRDGENEAECTLRAAIQLANDTGALTLEFNIPGDGPQSIVIESPLPAITQRMTLDATTQPGFEDRPVVEVDGSGAGGDGLTIEANGTIVKSLSIGGFSGHGIVVSASNVTVTGSNIGSDDSFGRGGGNGGDGIHAEGAADNLTIGGDTEEDGNVIGSNGGDGIAVLGPDGSAAGKSGGPGNTSINLLKISNNFLGTVVGSDGVARAIANSGNGVRLGNVVGGLVSLNTIAGNALNGIELFGESSGNLLKGNDIGAFIKRAGEVIEDVSPMGNGTNGIYMHSGANGNEVSAAAARLNYLLAQQQYAIRLVNASQNKLLDASIGAIRNIQFANGKRAGASVASLSNQAGGICIEDSEGNIVGEPDHGNLIGNSASGPGILIKGSGSTDNKIQSNLIGTDEDGEALGNAGDGIRVEEGADANVIGGESEDDGNIIGNNGGNGIYLVGPDEDAAGKNSGQALQLMQVINNRVGGLISSDGIGKVVSNTLNGVCLQNVSNALVGLNAIVGNGKNGIELTGSLSTSNIFEGNDIGALLKRSGSQILEAFPFGNGENGVLIQDGPSENEFRAAGDRWNNLVSQQQYAFRLIRSTLNKFNESSIGVVRNLQSSPTGKQGAPATSALSNEAGGFCLEESSRNEIGAPNKGNIIANSLGGNGILIKGFDSIQNVIQSNIIGSDENATTGIGNSGDGIRIEDGASENTIGGDGDDSGNMIAGNGGNGIYLLGPSNDALAKNGPSALLGFNVLKNTIGAVVDATGIPSPIGNALNGICMQNISDSRVGLNSIVDNALNGIELSGSLSTANIFEGNDIGGLLERAGNEVSGVTPLGNGENGIFMHSGATRNEIRSAGGRISTLLAQQQYAIRFVNSSLNKVHDLSMGIVRNLRVANAKQASAPLVALSNGAGGICIEDSPNNEIGLPGAGNDIANNGGPGIIVKGAASLLNRIRANRIGTDEAGTEGIGNTGDGILVMDGAGETEIGGATETEGNYIAGNGGSGLLGSVVRKINVLGNNFGISPIGSVLANGGGLKLVDVTQFLVGNQLRGNSFAGAETAVDVSGSQGGSIDNNDIAIDGAPTGAAAISVHTNSSDIGIGSRDYTADVASEPGAGNSVTAHECVHVMESSNVSIKGTECSSPLDDVAAAVQKMILVQSSENVDVGDVQRGNTLSANGESGIVVIESANVAATSNDVSRAAVGIESQFTDLLVKQNRLSEMVTAILAKQSQEMRVILNTISASTGPNSGIHFDGSSGLIEGNTITMDAGNAVSLNTGSNPVVRTNNISGSAGFGLVNTDASVTIDARNNWWGHESGPSGEGSGSGDAVSTFVNFSDWLSAPRGLVVSSASDTVYAIPGDTVVVEFTVQNLAEPNDVVDVSVDEQRGWLTSPAAIPLPLEGTSQPVRVRLFLPATASESSAVTVEAVSQADAQVSDTRVVTVIPATAAASVALAANQSNVTLSTETARIDILTNASPSADMLRLYEMPSSSSASQVLDDRVTSNDDTIVRVVALAKTAWALRSDVVGNPAAAAFGKAGWVAGPSPYVFNACFSTAGQLDVLTDLERAVVLYRDSALQRWQPLPSRRTVESGPTDFVCSDSLSQTGWYTLGAGAPAAPSAPALLRPEPKRTGVASDPILYWSSVAGAYKYEVEVATDTFFSAIDYHIETNRTDIKAAGLVVNSIHYWRARAGNDLGYGPWSATRTFTTSSTGVATEDPTAPPIDTVSLEPNYPNPFSDRTQIVVNLPETRKVHLQVFDLQGRRIATLVDGLVPAGRSTIVFQSNGLASGVYICRLEVEDGVFSRQMILVR